MKQILRIFRNQMHARDAWASDKAALADSLVAATFPSLWLATDKTKIFYRSAQAIRPQFYLGMHFDEIIGADYIDDIDTRNDLLSRLNA